MTMSNYESLGGPPSGLIVNNEPDIAERLDKITFLSMTANFDAAKSAALAISMLDWRDHGKSYARKMIAVARALATALTGQGIAVFTPPAGATSSHQFAIQAAVGKRHQKRLQRPVFWPAASDCHCLRSPAA
jgi:glycine hydroxymethyltransferase